MIESETMWGLVISPRYIPTDCEDLRLDEIASRYDKGACDQWQGNMVRPEIDGRLVTAGSSPVRARYS